MRIFVARIEEYAEGKASTCDKGENTVDPLGFGRNLSDTDVVGAVAPVGSGTGGVCDENGAFNKDRVNQHSQDWTTAEKGKNKVSS